MSEPDAKLFRIRRLGRRLTPGGPQLSSAPTMRLMQLRWLGMGLFLVLMLALLVLRKLASWSGQSVWIVFGVSGAVTTGAIAFGLRRARRRRNAPEPADFDEELSSSAIESALRSGRLSAVDLIFEGGVWTTLLESAPFGEAASERHQRAVRASRLKLAAAIVVGIPLAIGLIAMLMNGFDLILWLAE